MTLREELMAKGKGNYGNNKPPVSGQFKPGQSGYPPGRPKGSRNHRTILQAVVTATVAINENGKRVRKQKWEVMLLQQANKALAGDLKAAQFVFGEMRFYGLLVSETEAEPAKLAPSEQLVFDELARRIRASPSPSNPAEPESDENSPETPPTPTDEDDKP
jgi:hypothetical protein